MSKLLLALVCSASTCAFAGTEPDLSCRVLNENFDREVRVPAGKVETFDAREFGTFQFQNYEGAMVVGLGKTGLSLQLGGKSGSWTAVTVPAVSEKSGPLTVQCSIEPRR